MFAIALAGQKGGSGKTTLSTSTAVCALSRGYRTCLIDVDPQRSLSEWGERRRMVEPRVISTDVAHVVAVLRELEQDSDVVIIDCPGENSYRTDAIMEMSDLVLIPCRPTILDLKASIPVVETLDARSAEFGFVLNQCVAHSSRASQFSALLTPFGCMAGIPIVSRVDYQDAVAEGLGVTEYAPASSAAHEIQVLWNWIDTKRTSKVEC